MGTFSFVLCILFWGICLSNLSVLEYDKAKQENMVAFYKLISTETDLLVGGFIFSNHKDCKDCNIFGNNCSPCTIPTKDQNDLLSQSRSSCSSKISNFLHDCKAGCTSKLYKWDQTKKTWYLTYALPNVCTSCGSNALDNGLKLLRSSSHGRPYDLRSNYDYYTNCKQPCDPTYWLGYILDKSVPSKIEERQRLAIGLKYQCHAALFLAHARSCLQKGAFPIISNYDPKNPAATLNLYKGATLSSDGQYITSSSYHLCSSCPYGHIRSYPQKNLNSIPGSVLPASLTTKTKFQNMGVIFECKPCLRGGEPNPDQTACRICEKGKYSPGSSNCMDCGAGKYPTTFVDYFVSTKYEKSATECKDCPPGRVRSQADVDEKILVCKVCPNGFQPNEERTECVKCPHDEFSNGDGICRKCTDPSQYVDPTSPSKCLKCDHPTEIHKPDGKGTQDDCKPCPGIVEFYDVVAKMSKTQVCSGHGTCSWEMVSTSPQCNCMFGWSGETCTLPTQGNIHVGAHFNCSIGAYRHGCSNCIDESGKCACLADYSDGPGVGQYGCMAPVRKVREWFLDATLEAFQHKSGLLDDEASVIPTGLEAKLKKIEFEARRYIQAFTAHQPYDRNDLEWLYVNKYFQKGADIFQGSCESAIRLNSGHSIRSGFGALSTIKRSFSIELWLRSSEVKSVNTDRFTFLTLSINQKTIFSLQLVYNLEIVIVGENLSNSGKTTISKSFPVKTGENWRYLSIAYEEPFGTDQTGGHADLWVDGVRLGHLPLDMKLREILKNQVELTIEVGMPNNVPLHWIEIDNVRVFDYALVVDQLSSVLHARMCEDEHLLPHSSPKSRLPIIHWKFWDSRQVDSWIQQGLSLKSFSNTVFMNSSVIKEVDKPISKVGSIEISQEKKPIDWRIESKFSGFVNVTLSGWFSGIMDGIFEGTLNNMQIPLPKESFVGHIEGEFVGNAFGQMNGSAFGEGNYSRVWVPIYPPSAPASFLYSEDSIINIVPSVQFSDYESMIHPESFVECYYDQYGRDYRGQVSKSQTQKNCRNWKQSTIIQQSLTAKERDEQGIGDHNYCRTATIPPSRLQTEKLKSDSLQQATRPWCYTTSTTWEFCNIGTPEQNCLAVGSLIKDKSVAKQRTVYAINILERVNEIRRDLLSRNSHPSAYTEEFTNTKNRLDSELTKVRSIFSAEKLEGLLKSVERSIRFDIQEMKLQLTGLLEGLSDQIKESELNIIIHSVETALSNAKEEKKLLELESKLQLETFKDQKEVLNAKKNVISKLIQTYTDESERFAESMNSGLMERLTKKINDEKAMMDKFIRQRKLRAITGLFGAISGCLGVSASKSKSEIAGGCIGAAAETINSIVDIKNAFDSNEDQDPDLVDMKLRQKVLIQMQKQASILMELLTDKGPLGKIEMLLEISDIREVQLFFEVIADSNIGSGEVEGVMELVGGWLTEIDPDFAEFVPTMSRLRVTFSTIVELTETVLDTWLEVRVLERESELLNAQIESVSDDIEDAENQLKELNEQLVLIKGNDGSITGEKMEKLLWGYARTELLQEATKDAAMEVYFHKLDQLLKELNSLANQYEIVTLRSLNRKQLLQANGPKKDSVIESAIQRIQDSILFISVEYSKWINSKGIETDCFSQFTLNRWDQPETFESLRNTGEAIFVVPHPQSDKVDKYDVRIVDVFAIPRPIYKENRPHDYENMKVVFTHIGPSVFIDNKKKIHFIDLRRKVESSSEVTSYTKPIEIRPDLCMANTINNVQQHLASPYGRWKITIDKNDPSLGDIDNIVFAFQLKHRTLSGERSWPIIPAITRGSKSGVCMRKSELLYGRECCNSQQKCQNNPTDNGVCETNSHCPLISMKLTNVPMMPKFEEFELEATFKNDIASVLGIRINRISLRNFDYEMQINGLLQISVSFYILPESPFHSATEPTAREAVEMLQKAISTGSSLCDGNMSKFFDCCTNTECSGAQFDNDFVAPIAYKESSSSESDENNDEKHGHKTIEMETIMIGGGGIAALACVLFVISRCTRKKKQPPVSIGIPSLTAAPVASPYVARVDTTMPIAMTHNPVNV